MNSENTVLLVTSQNTLAKKVQDIFKSDFPKFELLVMENGVRGLNAICQSPPAFVLVDSTLTDISGLQICRILKHDPTLRKLPLLMITQEAPEKYQHFSELTAIADAFVEEAHLGENFSFQFKMLLELYQGLEDAERQHINLLQTETVQVQALSRVAQLLDQSITEVAVMKAFRQLFESITNKNVLHHMLFSLMENVLDYDVAGIFFNENNRDPRLIAYHTPYKDAIQDLQISDFTAKVFDELKSQSTSPWQFTDYRQEMLYPSHAKDSKPINLKHHSVFPFYVENTLLGALVFYNRKPVNYEMIFPFDLIMQEISALMRLRYYYSEAQTLTISDPLTGLHTYQHFMWCLEREVRQAKRHETPLTLAIFCVDDFREMNTQWGHAIADETIKNVARFSIENVRNVDLLARASGRKILALFPNSTPDGAMIPIERIKNKVLASPISFNNKTITCSLSIGVVGLGDSVQSAIEFVEAVQGAAHEANKKGPNQIELVK